MSVTCIAEVGGNHRGELHTALRMIDIVAGYCTEHFQLDGARPRPYVKFQKRTCSLDLYPDWAEPHPESWHAYGDSYLEHRRTLEFDRTEHARLMAACRFRDVGYACSVWDIPAADDIITLSPEWLKVPSACNLDVDLLEHIVRRFRGDIHVSLGMTTRTETEAVVRHLDTLGALPRTVLYACTSNYPVEHADVCLSEIAWLRERYGRAIKAVGFSGHHHGIALDMAAVALGAEYIERHFTLNRTWRGTDHAASLEPGGFRRLIRDVGAVSAGMGRKPADGLLACEQGQREKLKRGGIPCHA